jgi:multiple sugar transport system substrate-binding protein
MMDNKMMNDQDATKDEPSASSTPIPESGVAAPLSRRNFLGLAGAGVIGVTLAGSKVGSHLVKTAAPERRFTSNVTKATTLTFWNSFTASDRPFVEAIVAKYNSTQSKVHINMTIMPGDVLQEKLLISLGTGTGPDIPTAPGGPLQALPQFANAGVIQPVDFVYGTDGVDRSVLPSDFFPAVTYKQKLYGVPMTIQPVCMYYNPEIFKSNSIAVPDTVEELIAALIKITKTGISGMPLATTGVVDWWSLWLWAYGGNYNQGARSLLTTKASEAGFSAWGNMTAKYKVSPLNLTGAQGDSLFVTKQSATDISGPWVVAGFTQAKLPFEVIPFPAGPGGAATLGTGATMMLSSSCKELDAARDFFTFWTSKWAALEYAKSGSNALRTDLDAEVAALGKYPGKFAQMLPHIRYSLTGIVDFSEASAVITEVVQGVESGQSAPSVLSSNNGKFQQYLSAK